MAKAPTDPGAVFERGVAYIPVSVAVGELRQFKDAVLPLLRYTRHFADCEMEQRASTFCTCGLADALALALPD